MSWSTVNEVLGLAIVDPIFRSKLLSSPLSAVQEREFDLTSEELRIIQEINARDLAEFSQCIIDNFYPEKQERW